jgi:hypothetical protein
LEITRLPIDRIGNAPIEAVLPKPAGNKCPGTGFTDSTTPN